jgi:Flp pilus assembly protein TadG
VIVEKMIRAFRRLFRCTTATAAVETAIFAPIFLTLMLGVTDLGSDMFVRMTVNAAAQAGAAYAVINSCTTSCLANIQSAMNDATGNPSFCTTPGSTCTATPTPASCAAGSVCTITVTAGYRFAPILPVSMGSFAQLWTKSMTVSSTATIRVQ